MDELPGDLSHDVRLRFLASIGQGAQSVGGNRYIALAQTPEVHRRLYAPASIGEPGGDFEAMLLDSTLSSHGTLLHTLHHFSNFYSVSLDSV
jgi:hypothetical protein